MPQPTQMVITCQLLQEAEAAAQPATDPSKDGVRRKSRPLTSALVSLRSRRSSAVQSLMYDEEGNRRRLFSGSSAGGGVSHSGDSVSSQARMRPCRAVKSRAAPPARTPWLCALAFSLLCRYTRGGSRSGSRLDVHVALYPRSCCSCAGLDSVYVVRWRKPPH